MVRINSLYSLEAVRPYYFINDKLEIVNTRSNKIMKIWKSVRGYPTVTLQAEGRKRGINIPLHKLVALAFIENHSYQLIEHKDDNKLDYSVHNLKFSDKSSNGKNAFLTGCCVRKERMFKLTLITGQEYMGTIKNLSRDTGISKATLYDRVHKKRNPLFDGHAKTRRNKILTIQEL